MRHISFDSRHPGRVKMLLSFWANCNVMFYVSKRKICAKNCKSGKDNTKSGGHIFGRCQDFLQCTNGDWMVCIKLYDFFLVCIHI